MITSLKKTWFYEFSVFANKLLIWQFSSITLLLKTLYCQICVGHIEKTTEEKWVWWADELTLPWLVSLEGELWASVLLWDTETCRQNKPRYSPPVNRSYWRTKPTVTSYEKQENCRIRGRGRNRQNWGG